MSDPESPDWAFGGLTGARCNLALIREHIRKNGQWRDSIVHAILDHEWRSTAP
ncbi:hypothetical protein ACH427_29415 [Streptomyces sp. NPDC020379]|uniref:hypothetical protein n=1 Tax=Streptomyces sp. NPDC020379 TaxID=3365071 RepID=UPI0037960AA8